MLVKRYDLSEWHGLFNGLDDLKVALYVCPDHMDDDIHSDHSYLDTLGIPLNPTLKADADQPHLHY